MNSGEAAPTPPLFAGMGTGTATRLDRLQRQQEKEKTL
jgi:hypothetical protein